MYNRNKAPLSKTQMGIYAESMAFSESTLYNIPLLCKLGEDISIERLKDAIAKAGQAHPGLNTRIYMDENGEVLQQMDFAMALADAAREAGVHVAVETTGYAQPEKFREFMEHIDLFLFDFKHTDREAHFAGTGVYNDVILTNLQQLVAAGKQVVARIPVIPKFNSGIPAAKAMAQKLRELGVRQVHLLPFHQFGQNKYTQLGIPYEMEQMKQLHPEVLGNYQQVFLDAGLDCSFH